MDNRHTMKGFRCLAYFVFALGAFTFWAVFYALVLGILPFPAEPECVLELGGCPPPSMWEQAFNFVIAFGTIPLTAIAFMFFRRWVRKGVGLQNEW
jgi:hypothetical protein